MEIQPPFLRKYLQRPACRFSAPSRVPKILTSCTIAIQKEQQGLLYRDLVLRSHCANGLNLKFFTKDIFLHALPIIQHHIAIWDDKNHSHCHKKCFHLLYESQTKSIALSNLSNFSQKALLLHFPQTVEGRHWAEVSCKEGKC